MREYNFDIAIIGGSLGGCAAALSACEYGKKVIMTEESLWIGGQLTSQAVPPDENQWIENLCGTESYHRLRQNIRNYYKNHYPLTDEARNIEYLNPGGGFVSPICHEPIVAHEALRQLLLPYISNGLLSIFTDTVPFSARTDGSCIQSVTVKEKLSGDTCEITAEYFLDATDCGDLLPLIGADYVTGSESISQTGEPHALAGAANPKDMQATTWCFAMDYVKDEDFTISKPEDYDFWKNYRADFWVGSLLSFDTCDSRNCKPRRLTVFDEEDSGFLWNYRKILDKKLFRSGFYQSDITSVNWPVNDYWLGNLYDEPEKTVKKHMDGARSLSLSLLYWLQTEAPTHDGKSGYPGFRLRGDVNGTKDGLAMRPYIRESRRIKAEYTILEQDISAEWNPGKKAQRYPDSVGIGAYFIDLHPSTGGRNYIYVPTLPFTIPLGAMIERRFDNLIPSCKNIGTTHITNGAYRLHPVEWNIGETAGWLAAYCMEHKMTPRSIYYSRTKCTDFQNSLIRRNVPLYWDESRM